MTSSALIGGLALALASALALDAGFLIQQRAVSRSAEVSLRRPLASARALLASGRWLGGFGLGLGGWGLYFAALSLAPLSLVQTVAASGIGLLVVLSSVGHRALPPRRELAGAALATAGLVALAASIRHSPAATSSAPSPVALAALAGSGLILVAFALRRRSASLGGLAAGLCYGIGDVTSKALLIALPHHPGATALLASPFLYATAAAHLLGFAVILRAFQHGGAIASLGPMTAATNLVPMGAGVLLLGEHLPAGGIGLALRLAAFAAAAGGAWALSERSGPAVAAAPEVAHGLPSSLSTAVR